MRPQDLKQKLEGIFGFVITPFQQDHTLDLTGLAMLVERDRKLRRECYLLRRRRR